MLFFSGYIGALWVVVVTNDIGREGTFFVDSFINDFLCLEMNLFLKFLDVLLEVLCLSLEFLVLFLDVSLYFFFFGWDILVVGKSNRKRFER